MKRILFVDDEPLILAGLQNLLRKQRKQWEMVFVESGERALAKLTEAPFDVIVGDMRMPGMDFDSTYLQAFGVESKLPAWRETVSEIMSRMGAG